MKWRDEQDGDYPPGVSGKDPHFDMPSVGHYERHRECSVCQRGVHPARLCKCSRCKELE